MKFLLPALAFFLAASTALAIEVSEEMLNTYVQQGFAERSNRNIQILNPKVALLEGYATLCATARTKAFPKDVDFCADLTPKWRPETGSLVATRMALVSLNAPGVSAQNIELVKMIMNQVILPGLDGVELYKADNFIGKRISGLKVMPGKLDIAL